METQTPARVLGAGRARVVATATIAVLGAVLSACGGRVSTREPEPSSTLSDLLQTMTPQAQLDTLRVLMPSHDRDPMMPFFVGNAYVALGDGMEADRTHAIAYYDSAVAAYQRAADLDSTFSRAYVNMGLAEDEAGRPGRAREAYQKAIAVNPKDVLAYCHLGSLAHSSGDLGEAVRLYETALRIDPASAQAHYDLGLAFAETKLFREALVEWEQVMKLDPDGQLGATAGENVRIIRQYLGEGP